MILNEAPENILESLRSDPGDDSEYQPPHELKKYSYPIAIPLRADPPILMNWPERIIPDSTNQEQTALLCDYEMLVNANSRAGKDRQEALAHFALGIVLDNLEKPEKSIPHYLRFLEVMMDENDRDCVTVAFNVLGVDFQLLGPAYLKHSVYCHKKYSDLADEEGKFLSGVNTGLLYLNCSMLPQAKNSFQAALKHAIETQSNHAQAIAIAFQALVSIAANKLRVAKVCLERYLQLAVSLRDAVAQAKASLNLGHVCWEEGDTEMSEKYYLQAIRAANFFGIGDIEKNANVCLGMMRSQKPRKSKTTISVDITNNVL